MAKNGTAQTKMICVRVPVDDAHVYQVNLRQGEKTAQGHLLGAILSFNADAEKKKAKKTKK